MSSVPLTKAQACTPCQPAAAGAGTVAFLAPCTAATRPMSPKSSLHTCLAPLAAVQLPAGHSTAQISVTLDPCMGPKGLKGSRALLV